MSKKDKNVRYSIRESSDLLGELPEYEYFLFNGEPYILIASQEAHVAGHNCINLWSKESRILAYHTKIVKVKALELIITL